MALFILHFGNCNFLTFVERYNYLNKHLDYKGEKEILLTDLSEEF